MKNGVKIHSKMLPAVAFLPALWYNVNTISTERKKIMNKTRVMSLIMALILIASAVMSVSCGEKTGGNVTEAPATEAPAVQTDEKTEPQATIASMPAVPSFTD